MRQLEEDDDLGLGSVKLVGKSANGDYAVAGCLVCPRWDRLVFSARSGD